MRWVGLDSDCEDYNTEEKMMKQNTSRRARLEKKNTKRKEKQKGK